MSIDISQIKVIFMGTPQFSVPILDALIQNYDVIGVAAQPDKKSGRKQVINISPIKEIALIYKIPVFQPEKMTEQFVEQIKQLNPDLIVVASYGFILPSSLLEIPKYGVINVHPSLLPKYRGPSPIQSAILNGDKKTGVSIMKVSPQMDQGDILSQRQAEIADDETYQTLHDKLSILSTHLLIDTLPKYLNGEIKPQKQDDQQATYCQIIKREDGKIDWTKNVSEIDAKCRAFDPWPGCWTEWNGKKLKIIKSKKLDTLKYKEHQPGEVFKQGNIFAVKCGKGALQLFELQLEGKKVMSDKEFFNGYGGIVGSVLK